MKVTKNRLRYLAKGFALGHDAAEKEHGAGCCGKNCTTAFANAFAEQHAEAPSAVYRAVAEAYSRWKIVGWLS